MKFNKITGVFLSLTIFLMSVCTPSYAQDSKTITVTFNASRNGELIEEATMVSVSLSGKETYNLDDVFTSAHNLFYEGEGGYESGEGDYGTYVTKFWGDESGNFGYQINGGDKYVGGLDTVVEDGDYIDAVIYENKYPDTEVYTKFDSFKKEVQTGEEFVMTLYQAGYDENWNMVFSPCEGATVVCDGKEYITDSDGNVSLNFENFGKHIVTAKKFKTVKDRQVSAITAPVCEVSVKPTYNAVMDNIADVYGSESILTDGNMIWFLADMQVYDRLFPEKGKGICEDVKRECVKKIVSDASSSSVPSVLAKSIIALRALGYDATKVYDKNFKNVDPVGKLRGLIDEKSEAVTDVYTISYVLLSLNQGEEYLSDEQRDYMISEIIANKESWQENPWGTDAAAAMLLALAPYYDENENVRCVADETIEIIKNAQNETGSIGNAASTGLAMVALSAYGIDSTDVITNGKTLTDALMSMASENYDGFEPMENSFSTEQGFRGLLSLELLKNDMGRMYDFKSNPENPLWETGEPAGCPVVFYCNPQKAEIEITDAVPFEEGKYDLEEGTYTYNIYASGYKNYQGTITVSPEDAQNHIPKEINISLKKKSGSASGTGGSSSGGKAEDVSDTRTDENEEEQLNEKTYDKDDGKEETQKNIFNENTFNDVKSSDWYYDSVKYAYENNLMQGTEKGFEPESNMTRAMLVTILYRLESPKGEFPQSRFEDVSENAWYYNSVAWAAKEEIVSGISEDAFSPDENITREQFAVIMYRYALYKGYDTKSGGELSRYNDEKEISDWAVDALKWADSQGIITGTGDAKVSPRQWTTRSQGATILMRFCEGIKN